MTYTEIAQRLHISENQVKMSPTIQNTYRDIKNNPNMSQQEKEDAFDEMADILKDMLHKKA
ncbi:hypothetical protein [Garciella nitratireducens]|uniref:hypothetical protein n=1 Tax=Garciella nitratireducens TaxID=218205 RepID=UPI000DEA703D|nr:hypothetical protein [Garciella nitratireducens]RBP44993.1 hypothetical protein DFR81_103167 [Garciella nitratireducens]